MIKKVTTTTDPYFCNKIICSLTDSTVLATLEVSVYNVYVTNQFQPTFALVGWGGGVGRGVKFVEMTVSSKEENS
jgi:hypothetical protein